LLNDISLAGCQSLLLNITAGSDILMSEFEEVSNVIVNETGKNANIFMGTIFDDTMAGKISVTIIATGLGKEEEMELPLEAPIPVQNRTQTIPPKNPNDEITEIFKRLNINDPALDTEKKQAANAEEPTRIQPLRTDVPSFLKALD